MKNSKQIPIFFSCDDNYIPFMAVAIQSFKENASKEYDYRIIVLHTNSIALQNQNKIISKYQDDNFSIEFADITERIEMLSERLHTRDYYSKSTYYRLFIPSLYPELDKALYLDSDITVLGDISKLYFEDLGSNYVGAVTDQVVQCQSEFVEYVERRIGVKTAKDYFNAGILLMNLEKMRLFNFEEKFIRLLLSVTFSVAQDQDYLNVLCKDKVKLLDSSWNVMPIKDDKITNINLIHYNLGFKPWQIDNVLYEKYFWTQAKKTDYYKQIKKVKASFGKEKKRNSQIQTINLIAKAHEEALDDEGNVFIEQISNEIIHSEMFVLQRLRGRKWNYQMID